MIRPSDWIKGRAKVLYEVPDTSTRTDDISLDPKMLRCELDALYAFLDSLVSLVRIVP